MSEGQQVRLSPPNVEFYLFYSDSPPPEPATSTVLGSLPARAVQVCTPVLDASAFGWYIFPPVDFALRWDGRTTEFARLVENEPGEWISLTGRHEVALAEHQEALSRAPEHFKKDFPLLDGIDGRIRFIDAHPLLANTCEVIPGILARTTPGWSLLVRSVPNWPVAQDYQVLEGVIDTDWWGNYIPVMVRVHTPNKVIRFHRRQPLAVVQPIPRVAVEASRHAPARVVSGIENFSDEIWAWFVANRRRRLGRNGPGSYRAEQRRRGRAAATTATTETELRCGGAERPGRARLDPDEVRRTQRESRSRCGSPRPATLTATGSAPWPSITFSGPCGFQLDTLVESRDGARLPADNRTPSGRK